MCSAALKHFQKWRADPVYRKLCKDIGISPWFTRKGVLAQGWQQALSGQPAGDMLPERTGQAGVNADMLEL